MTTAAHIPAAPRAEPRRTSIQAWRRRSKVIASLRVVLPAVIGVIAYTVVAAAPLYWVTSNSFMILQEYLAGRRFKPQKVDKK